MRFEMEIYNESCVKNKISDRGLRLKRHEEGYVLASVLIVLVLLSTVIGLIMIGITTQNRFIQRDIHAMKARYHAEAGIWKFLWDKEMWSDTDRSHFTIVTENRQEVFVTRTGYGGYWIITSETTVGGSRKRITAMVGEKGGELFEKAIVLGDVKTPLTLTGSSVVNGNIQTGPEGIQYRPFRGHLFTGSFTGDVSVADSSALPRFNPDLVNRELDRLQSMVNSTPEKSTMLESPYVNVRFLKNFGPEEKIFIRKGDLTIDSSDMEQLPDSTVLISTGSMSVSGKIDTGRFTRFVAGDTLRVAGELKGEHALLYAGKSMQINGESVLSGQFFSDGDMTLAGNTYLTYPSLLYARPGLEGSVKTGRITLRDNVKLDGVVMLPDIEEGLATGDRAMVAAGENVIVRGAVYSTSRTELHGTVYGTVMTNQFYFYISPTTYLNWLKDAGIDLYNRPSPFVVPIGFSPDKQFEIIYWEESKTDHKPSMINDREEL